MLSMGLRDLSNIENTWLNKVPIPLPSNVTKQTDVSNISSSTLYIHALYFAANTMSHVAIGDLTSVNTEERVLNAFMIWLLTFFYAFCFANISSIFNEDNDFLYFNAKYNHIMSSIPKEKIDDSVMNKINQYYEYLWQVSHGYDEEKDILRHLPAQIMYDAIMDRYQEGI